MLVVVSSDGHQWNTDLTIATSNSQVYSQSGNRFWSNAELDAYFRSGFRYGLLPDGTQRGSSLSNAWLVAGIPPYTGGPGGNVYVTPGTWPNGYTPLADGGFQGPSGTFNADGSPRGASVAPSSAYQTSGGSNSMQNAQSSNNPFGNSGGFNANNSNLLFELLAEQPFLTNTATRMASAAATIAGAGGPGASCDGVAQAANVTMEFAAVQSWVGTLDFDQALSGNTTQNTLLTLLFNNILALAPAATALAQAAELTAPDIIAGSAGTTVPGPELAKLATAWGTFASATAALGSSFSGANSALLIALFTQSSQQMPIWLLAEVALIGPATNTFVTACSVAAVALAADATYTAAKPDAATWFAAFAAYLSSIAQTRLFGALGR